MTPPKLDLAKICPELHKIFEAAWDYLALDTEDEDGNAVHPDKTIGLLQQYLVNFDDLEDVKFADLYPIATTMLKLAEALDKIEQKTKKIIEHPPSPDPTLPIMLANALVAVNNIAVAARKGDAGE